MESKITLREGRELSRRTAAIPPTETNRRKLILSGALFALGALTLLAGAFYVRLFKMPATVAVSSVAVLNREPLPFGPGWAANYYTDLPRPMPFGPEIAADYGRPKDPLASIYRLPFGPQIAADYGRPNDPLAYIYRLPFGPGWAATYGVPASSQ